MSIGLIGTKIGMTRQFMESGQSIPVTVIKVEKGRSLEADKFDGFWNKLNSPKTRRTIIPHIIKFLRFIWYQNKY